MVQLWVNLPAKHKMDPPGYQGLTHADMGKVDLAEDGGTVNVIAGSFNAVKGPAKTFTPIELWDVRLNAGGRMAFDLPASYNAGLLLVKGSVTVNGQQAPTDHFVLFTNEGEHIEVVANEEAIVLLLAGVADLSRDADMVHLRHKDEETAG